MKRLVVVLVAMLSVMCLSGCKKATEDVELSEEKLTLLAQMAEKTEGSKVFQAAVIKVQADAGTDLIAPVVFLFIFLVYLSIGKKLWQPHKMTLEELIEKVKAALADSPDKVNITVIKIFLLWRLVPVLGAIFCGLKVFTRAVYCLLVVMSPEYYAYQDMLTHFFKD